MRTSKVGMYVENAQKRGPLRTRGRRCEGGGVRGGGLSEPRLSPVIDPVFTPRTSAAERSTNCARPLGASMAEGPPRADTPVYVFCTKRGYVRHRCRLALRVVLGRLASQSLRKHSPKYGCFSLIPSCGIDFQML